MSNKKIPIGVRMQNIDAGIDSLKNNENYSRTTNVYNHIDLDKTNKLIKEINEIISYDEFLKIFSTNKEIQNSIKELVIKSINIIFKM